MITIKKYGNRRLYDSARSSYINLDELAVIIRGGEEVEVVDAKTGEDLTREVMLQVFMEVLKGTDFFPTGLLRRVIRLSGDEPGHQLLRQQLVSGLELLFTQLDRVEAALGGKANPWTQAWPGFAGMGGAAGAPSGAPAQRAPSESAPPMEPEPEDPEGQAAEELDTLRARLARLEERLKR